MLYRVKIFSNDKVMSLLLATIANFISVDFFQQKLQSTEEANLEVYIG